MTPTETRSIDRRVRIGWGAALIALAVWVIWRIGGFDLTTTLESGRTVPNTWGSVDHPFHASRAASLLASLRNGEILRWMGNHQGGYPVEFYPLGVAWLDIGVWAVLLGAVPILAVHKLTVALVFVLPALAYWLLARGDKLHPSIAFLAMALHIAIPGYWLNGGYEELVGWGLVTNVAGATFAVISTVLLARFLHQREHWCGVAAVISIAVGTVSNPRSLFGVVLAAIAIAGWHIIVSPERPWRKRILAPAISIGIVAVLAFLLVAPVILPLMRYSSEYFFLHYQFYKPLSMFRDALEMALSGPVLLLAIGGAILVFVARAFGHLRISQTLVITTVLYSLFTMWVATTDNPPPLVEQLEAPRLMPYQRLLMLALAAIFIVLAVQWVTSRLGRVWREVVIAVVVLAAGIGSISVMDRGANAQLNEEALYPVTTIGDQRFADLEDAVRLANDLRPEGSAVFVIGNQQEWWHEQLWSPGIQQGTYYYDDWMWYWHRDQTGPYDNSLGYYMDNPTEALTAGYFADHGIGVVMVSDMWVPSGTPPRQTARNSPLLQYRETIGSWDVYTVNEPTSVATRGDANATSVDWSNQRIDLSFPEGGGDILVRQNWFPRWQAMVNGEPATIGRSASGYMVIHAPDGPVELTLTYGVTALDWAARSASILGVLGLAVFAVRGTRLHQREDEHAATH